MSSCSWCCLCRQPNLVELAGLVGCSVQQNYERTIGRCITIEKGRVGEDSRIIGECMLCGNKGAFKLNMTGTHRLVRADRVRSARIHGVRSERITSAKTKLNKMVKRCSPLKRWPFETYIIRATEPKFTFPNSLAMYHVGKINNPLQQGAEAGQCEVALLRKCEHQKATNRVAKLTRKLPLLRQRR